MAPRSLASEHGARSVVAGGKASSGEIVRGEDQKLTGVLGERGREKEDNGAGVKYYRPLCDDHNLLFVCVTFFLSFFTPRALADVITRATEERPRGAYATKKEASRRT